MCSELPWIELGNNSPYTPAKLLPDEMQCILKDPEHDFACVCFMQRTSQNFLEDREKTKVHRSEWISLNHKINMPLTMYYQAELFRFREKKCIQIPYKTFSQAIRIRITKVKINEIQIIVKLNVKSISCQYLILQDKHDF